MCEGHRCGHANTRPKRPAFRRRTLNFVGPYEDRPPGSVLLRSQLMGEHFAGTRYAQYFLSRAAAEELHDATETR